MPKVFAFAAFTVDGRATEPAGVSFTHRSGWSLHYRVLRITTSALKQRRRRVPRAEFSVATRESWLKKNLWRVLFGRI
jgi:hypothetical protein